MPIVRVEVRQGDIDKGNPKSGTYCMGYRAIKRIFPSVTCVGIRWVHFFKNPCESGGVIVPLPFQVGSIIFDNYAGRPVKPFWFDWEVPQEIYETKAGE